MPASVNELGSLLRGPKEKSHKDYYISIVSSAAVFHCIVVRNVEDWKTETGVPSSPVVVQCSDSWTQSGLFCVCYIICEKMTVEGQVSVYQTVKSVKLKRHQIVNSVVCSVCKLLTRMLLGIPKILFAFPLIVVKVCDSHSSGSVMRSGRELLPPILLLKLFQWRLYGQLRGTAYKFFRQESLLPSTTIYLNCQSEFQ